LAGAVSHPSKWPIKQEYGMIDASEFEYKDGLHIS